MKKVSTKLLVDLWKVNHVLRWTGWRFAISTNTENPKAPTRVGFVFWGWDFIRNGEK